MTPEQIKNCNKDELIKELKSIQSDLFACRNGCTNGHAYMDLKLRETAAIKRAQELTQ